MGLTLFTGVLGGTLARREGLKVWRAWRSALERLEPPAEGVVEGILVLVGGALLITPGVLTDLAGLALLLPWTRRRIALRVRRAVDRRIAQGRLQVITVGDPAVAARRDEVIETTGETLPERDDPRSRRS